MNDDYEIGEDYKVPNINEEEYDIGQDYELTLKDREYKYMLYLIAYDIADPKRLARVAKICMRYGIRVEKSVFECDLKQETFDMMWSHLTLTINADEDALISYRLTQKEINSVKIVGKVQRHQKRLFYLL